MKKTTKKLSLGMKIASVLACLAIVSVGFASWWIVNYPKPVENNDGSFEVYGVETKNIYFDNMSWGEGKDDALIIFGYPTGATTNKGWFGYTKSVADNDGGVEEEDMSAIFKFTLKADDEGAALNDYMDVVTVTFTPIHDDFNALVTESKYIAAPVIEYSLNGGTSWQTGATYNGAATTFDIEADSMTGSFQDIQLRFTFGWGEYFNDAETNENLNPYDFFNAQTYSVARGEEAASVMNAIKALETATYKVEIGSNPTGEATAPANN